jgi:hypothetical protein
VGEEAERGRRWRLGGLNRQRRGQGSGEAVASANGRARAGVTQWGQGDISLVALAGEGTRRHAGSRG